MVQQQMQRDKLVYLRQWVGDRVSVATINSINYKGILTNIVFDGTRLMYIMLDEKICINYDHIVEVRLER
jgi:RNase P/RNase MRP subunit p29